MVWYLLGTWKMLGTRFEDLGSAERVSTYNFSVDGVKLLGYYLSCFVKTPDGKVVQEITSLHDYAEPTLRGFRAVAPTNLRQRLKDQLREKIREKYPHNTATDAAAKVL